MLNRFLILLAFLILPQIALADVFSSPKSLEYIVPNLPQFSSVNCRFKQEKRMPNNVVLKSSGKFSFDRKAGVVFNTQEPIKAVNAYTSKDYNQINDIINAISNKKYSKLEHQFDFFYVNSTPWQFGLKPKKNSQTAKYLKSIEIYGTNKISKIVVTTNNSVKTTIWFYE